MAGAPPGKGGNAETLRRYWAEGEGAAKIRWGAPGDFDRCVNEVDKYMPGRAKGYCNLLHHRALGYYPATHAKMGASHGARNFVEDAVALGIVDPQSLALALFDPAKHPRGPKGASNGGKFAAGPARNSDAEAAQKDKGAQANADATVGAPDADAKLKALSDADLQALSKYAYSFKSSDPKVVALRIKIAGHLRGRGMDVNNFGGLGKSSSSKPAAKKAAKPVAKKAPKKVAAGHSSGDRVALAAPMVTSGDGPKVTMNGALTTPDHIKAAVKAHGKVPPQLQKGYRRKVIGAAKKMGALRHVPPAWLTGKGE
jgi:hypothetical protein